jgi:hypothetical protein
MPGFCTILGASGNNTREDYCAKMSTAGEFGNPETSGGCEYNSCNRYQDIGGGCCKGCCGIAGGGLKCQRLKFTGDPVACCLKDVNCGNPATNPPQCYSDAAKQHACADGRNGQPNYRSIVSSDCRDVLTEFCSGTLPTDDPTSPEWINRWLGADSPCVYALYRNILNIGGTGHCFCPTGPAGCANIPTPGICNIPLIGLDAQGYFWGQQLMGAAMEHYNEQGFSLGTLPGQPGYNPLQDIWYNEVCCPYPGLCQNGISAACATQTAQRLSLNPSAARWCGCHLSPEEYQEFSVRYNIPPQCTPMCNRADVLPIIGINGEPVTCRQDICLINNVNVNLINSQIGGGIQFNQVCGSCPNGQCSCVVDSTDVTIIDSIIGDNFIPVLQNCGSFVCLQDNPATSGPRTIPVDCGDIGFNPYDEYQSKLAAANAAAKQTSLFWVVVIIGAALVVVFLLILFLYPRSYGTNTGVTTADGTIVFRRYEAPSAEVVTNYINTYT